MKNFTIEKLNPFGVILTFEPKTVIADVSLANVVSILREEKLVVIRGLQDANSQEFLDFASEKNVDNLVHWSFGPLMELKVNPTAENYLFSREEVPFHWDGAFHVEPRILVFQCIQAPDKNGGGETVFTDTELLWNRANQAQRDRWNNIELRYETEKKAHYGGVVTTKMVQTHPLKRTTVLRYAEAVETQLNPVSLEVLGASSENELKEEMKGLIYSNDYMYTHQWQDEDVLLADNFSLIHGRRAFSSSSSRFIRRVQIK